MTGKYWKRICAIPAYMFLLSPSGNRVQKMEGGNWIDQHEAQKVVDAAEEELTGVLAERDALKAEQQTIECRFEVSEDTLKTIRGCLASAESDIDALKAECEGLRKDAERLEKATAFVRQLSDAAGKQPSVATGYLHDILTAMSKEAGQ